MCSAAHGEGERFLPLCAGGRVSSSVYYQGGEVSSSACYQGMILFFAFKKKQVLLDEAGSVRSTSWPALCVPVSWS